MNLRNRILITFLLLLTTPVLILAVVNGVELLILSDANARDSSEALTNDQLENLARVSYDEAVFIDETFNQFGNEITMLELYTEGIFNGNINITPTHSYYWNDAQELAQSGLTIPELRYDPSYGFDISYEVSCYYLPREHMRGAADPFDLSPFMQNILDLSSNMDNMFKALHEANSNYVWIYAGFEGEGHLFKNYPYADMSWCLDYEYYEGTAYQGLDYDPHVEEWYQNAAAVTDDSIAFTSPYFDPDVGLIISIGRPVRYSNGTRFGVVSADITITSIINNILSLKILENDYAYLLDKDGNVIAHPELDQEAEEPATIGELEFSRSNERQSFQQIVNKMKSGSSGVEPFTKDGEMWYISYVPINTSRYSLGIVVPESDIIASAISIQNKINTLSLQQTLLFAVILGIVIAGVVGVATITSSRIVRPVKELTTLVNVVSEGDLSRDLRGNTEAMGKEVATLHSAFDNILTSLRFGNTDYYRGDLKRAYENYRKALELFTTTKNLRGTAIAKNNLGNIYRAWDEFDRAKSNYEEAIEIGIQQGDKSGLASRYNNLGLLYLETKQYDLALQILGNARTIDEEIGNMRGLITRLGNIGIVYERLGDLNEAERLYKEAIRLSEKHNDNRGLANSYIKYAVFHILREQYNEAQDYLEKSFELAKSIDDVQLALNCLDRLATVYEELDKPTESHKARINTENIRRKIVNAKMALFIIDYSGSMHGIKIKSVRRGALKVLEDQINPQDKVGIVIFDSLSHTIHPLTSVEENERVITKKIKNLKYPQGATAFYDALGDALIFLNNEKGNEQKWIIALTDGVDNASHRFTVRRFSRSDFFTRLFAKTGPTSIPDFIDENLLTINMIIIGIGPEVREIEHYLRELCETTPRGKYIDVSYPRTRIEDAIEQAFEKISETMAEVDVEAFLPEEG
ncbi:MAG: tetratricopeptide repeat protein [Candidatus Heimdallarchaeota archaeon]|nr:MAG: tetratricopeptide repeat protein [Candidatus Heimdallarchaeota archaeon]